MSETVPVVGMGATLVYPQDRYPYVITYVSPSGKTFKCVPLRTVSKTTGHEPAYFEGPFPVWSHVYTDEELQSMVQATGAERTVRLTKKGWTSSGTPIVPGNARYHRNFSY